MKFICNSLVRFELAAKGPCLDRNQFLGAMLEMFRLFPLAGLAVVRISADNEPECSSRKPGLLQTDSQKGRRVYNHSPLRGRSRVATYCGEGKFHFGHSLLQVKTSRGLEFTR